MACRTEADDAADTAAGCDFAQAEPTYVALKADVDNGVEALESPCVDDGTVAGTFSRIRQTIESEWPDGFHEASKMFLASAVDDVEKIITTRTRINAIDDIRVPEAVETMIGELVSAVRKVHDSVPDASTRGAEFELDAEIMATLANTDQQITDMTADGQHEAVLALQLKKRDVFVESLADVVGVAQTHNEAIDSVCNASAATMHSVGEIIRAKLSECEEKLQAFATQIQSQTFATDIALQALKAAHKKSTARAVEAQEKQALDALSAAAEQAALLSGKTGADFTTIIEKTCTAATRQAEATEASEKLAVTSFGYDSTVELQYTSCTELQAKQSDALLTVQTVQSSLLGVSAIFTKAAAALVDTSAGWETLVNQSLIRVRTTKHTLVTQYHRWTTVNILTPAMKNEVKTNVQAAGAAAAEAVERECVDLDDPSALQDAVAAAKKTKAKHDKAVNRVAAAKVELNTLVTAYDYSDLRDQLTAAGVRIGADPSKEALPDTGGFARNMIARLKDSFLAIGF